jgi:hypothetical protein
MVQFVSILLHQQCWLQEMWTWTRRLSWIPAVPRAKGVDGRWTLERYYRSRRRGNLNADTKKCVDLEAFSGVFFWVLAPCSSGKGFRCFDGTRWLHLNPEEEGSMFQRNIWNFIPTTQRQKTFHYLHGEFVRRMPCISADVRFNHLKLKLV